VGPGELGEILCQIPSFDHPNLLVSGATMDDAGVYKLDSETALVQTVDYFTPMVDDPYIFGQVAAANALSDVYAMGGEPLTAMNITAFPTNCLSLDILREILTGGAEKVREAGAVIVGGHTIEDKEPKYGLAVTGLVHPDKIAGNSGAKPGDVVVLTKPLGTGIIATAIKGEIASPEAVKKAVENMTELNKTAAQTMQKIGVHGCTDVTGFGFLGHAWEICAASGVTMEVESSLIPLLPDVFDLANMGIVPAGAKANLKYLQDKVEFEGVSDTLQDILADPQTSGGLLITLPEDKGLQLIRELRNRGVLEANIIGTITESKSPKVIVKG